MTVTFIESPRVGVFQHYHDSVGRKRSDESIANTSGVSAGYSSRRIERPVTGENHVIDAKNPGSYPTRSSRATGCAIEAWTFDSQSSLSRMICATSTGSQIHRYRIERFRSQTHDEDGSVMAVEFRWQELTPVQRFALRDPAALDGDGVAFAIAVSAPPPGVSAAAGRAGPG